MKLNGAQIVIETLIEQGTTTVFGYPGGQVINIYDALYLASDRIHHIITNFFAIYDNERIVCFFNWKTFFNGK